MTEAPLFSKDEIRKIADELMALKKRIDLEWSQGKRDMMRANIMASADDVLRMMDAIDQGDVNAFRVAAQEHSDHARSLTFHSSAWLKKSREAAQ